MASATWWSASILWNHPGLRNQSRPAQPLGYEGKHDLHSLDPDALHSIRAFKAIALSLEAGRLAGVRENALAIAEFFAPMNPRIERAALALAEDTDLESARRHFSELTQAFEHPPPPSATEGEFEL